MYRIHGEHISSTMDFRFFGKNILWIVAVVLCAAMIVFPEISLRACKEAIDIWMRVIVPALFPFMIMADYIKKTSKWSFLGPRTYTPCIAILSGYPMGAKIAGDYYRDGAIDGQELRMILAYSMVTGPAFLVGAVGEGLYHSSLLGSILLISHYGSAILCGMIQMRTHPSVKRIKTGLRGCEKFEETPFTNCILDSFRGIGIILAYIIFFKIGVDLLEHIGVFAFWPSWLSALAKGLLEMTVGCMEIQAFEGSLLEKMTLTSFVISFGGFSVLGQTLTMLEGCPISFGALLRAKLFHGMISAIWTFTIVSFVV